MICQRGVRLPAPTAPGLMMRPTQRPAAGGGAFSKASSPPAAPGGPRAWGAPATPGSPAGAAGDNSHTLPALGPPAVPLPAVRPSQTPPPRRRGPRSPLAQPTGSPPVRRTAPPSHPPRPPVRLPPPSVSPFEIPLPAAAQRQGPLDRLWRFSSRAPKSDSPPIMIIIKGGHRRRGSRRLHSCL